MRHGTVERKWYEATVRYFDNLKGEGVIRDENGNSFFVHYSAIDRHLKLDKNFLHRVLFENQKVRVRILRDSHFTQIEDLI